MIGFDGSSLSFFGDIYPGSTKGFRVVGMAPTTLKVHFQHLLLVSLTSQCIMYTEYVLISAGKVAKHLTILCEINDDWNVDET